MVAATKNSSNTSCRNAKRRNTSVNASRQRLLAPLRWTGGWRWKPYESVQSVTIVIRPALTPLKLLQLHGMLSNGGRLVSPHITRGLRSGTELSDSSRLSGRQLLDPAVSQQVLVWMESVVEEGSGQVARIPGYRIGGKTGTAQKAANGVYIPGALITSFVAHLPVEDPRFVVLVVVDEPQGEHVYGSTVAAPVARSIIEALLVIEQIPPSKAIAKALKTT